MTDNFDFKDELVKAAEESKNEDLRTSSEQMGVFDDANRKNEEQGEKNEDENIIKLTPEILELRKKTEELEKEVEQNRKEYLEMDYKKNTALKRVRKYFFAEKTFKSDLNANTKNDPDANTDTGKYNKDQIKSLESDAEIAAFRAYYDNSLIKLRDAKIAEAKSRGADDGEIAEIFASFMLEQELKVQEVHDDVRAEHFDGKAFGFARDAMLDLSKEYRSMSLKKKLAVGAAFAGVGFGAVHLAGTAAVSAGAIAAMMAAKRTILGSLAGVSAAEGLAARNKSKRENDIEQEKKNFEQMLNGMTEDEKYAYLSKRTWDISIKDKKNAINEIKNKNLEHLAAGAVAGSILSTGLVGEVFKMVGGYVLDETSLGKLLAGGFNYAKDFFTHSDVSSNASNVHGTAASGTDLYNRLDNAGLRDPQTGKIIEEYKNHTLNKEMNVGVDHSESAKAGLVADEKAGTVEFGKVEGGIASMDKTGGTGVVESADKFNHTTPSGAMNAAEQAQHVKEVAAAEAAKTETISIKEPVKIHEGGKMRHDSFIRSLKDQLKSHPGIDKDDAGHIAEVTFHDAAKEYAKAHGLTYDQAFAKLSKIHPGTTYELKWDSEGHPHVILDDKNIKFVHNMEHHNAPLHAPNNIPSSGVADGNAASDTPTNETYKEWNKEVADAANQVNQEKYDIASAVARGELPALDPTSPNFSDNLGYAKLLKESASSNLYNWGPSYEVGRLGEVINESQAHMKSLLDMPDKETFTKIGKDFFDDKKSNILKFGGMKVQDALNDPSKMEGLSEKARKLIIGYANSDATKPKLNETFKLWSYRIMKLAKPSIENKLAA